MPRLLTRRCPECGGEGTVPTCPRGHDGCCPCVTVGTTCPRCGGNCEVEVPCGNCGESLLADEVDECRACKEALEEETMKWTRAVEVVDRNSGETVHSVDVTGKSDSQVERVVAGMSINLDHERYRLEVVSNKAPKKSATLLCSNCGDDRARNRGDDTLGTCGTCEEEASKAARRAAKAKAADLEDIRGDVLRDQRKDGVSA